MFLTLALAACATVLPEAESIRVTHEVGDVRGCRLLVALESVKPIWAPTDALVDLRNKTAAAGGDIFLVTSGLGMTIKGAAYRCHRPTG